MIIDDVTSLRQSRKEELKTNPSLGFPQNVIIFQEHEKKAKYSHKNTPINNNNDAFHKRLRLLYITCSDATCFCRGVHRFDDNWSLLPSHGCLSIEQPMLRPSPRDSQKRFVCSEARWRCISSSHNSPQEHRRPK